MTVRMFRRPVKGRPTCRPWRRPTCSLRRPTCKPGLYAPAFAVVLLFVAALTAQEPPAFDRPPTRADILRGEYGRYRANNDLLSYHLDVRVDPVKKWIAGKNTIRFRMLKDDTRIQIDLYAELNVDKILLGTTPLKYEREINAVFIDFPSALKSGREYAIDFDYSGSPTEDLVQFFNARFGQDLTPVFDQYLRRAALPRLDLAFNDREETLAYRWKADERGFAMPIRVGRQGAWQTIRPTTDWAIMPNTIAKDDFQVATDLYYVDVAKR
jgi:hypothetical protein